MDKKRIIISLLDRVIKLQENGHYASLDFSNYGYDISIHVIKDGFRMGNGYDFKESLMLTDENIVLSTMIRLDEIVEEWGVNNDELQTSES